MKSDQDKVTVIGAGVTLHEALKAAKELSAAGIAIRVIDLYCVKPIDGKALAAEVGATGGKLITVEDHWPEGGLGEASITAHERGGQASGEVHHAGCNRNAALRKAGRAGGQVRHLGASHRGRGEGHRLVFDTSACGLSDIPAAGVFLSGLQNSQ